MHICNFQACQDNQLCVVYKTILVLKNNGAAWTNCEILWSLAVRGQCKKVAGIAKLTNTTMNNEEFYKWFEMFFCEIDLSSHSKIGGKSDLTKLLLVNEAKISWKIFLNIIKIQLDVASSPIDLLIINSVPYIRLDFINK
jgi:hypothetical protein